VKATAAFDPAQAAKRKATLMSKVSWFDIYVDDIDRAQAFYETVLDTKLATMEDPTDATVQMRSFADDGESHGAGGALVKLAHASPGPGGSMVYFTCADCEVEQGRVEAAGGQIVRPKFSIGDHGFVSLMMDTEGNMVGLHSNS